MKKIIVLLTILLSLPAQANAVIDLITRYGKRAVMEVVGHQIGNNFTVIIEGYERLEPAPDPDYVTPETLASDVGRAGMSAKALELALLEKVKLDEEEKRRNAESEEHLKQWKIEQAKEAERRIKEAERVKAEEEELIRQQQMMVQIRAQIKQAYPDSKITPDTDSIMGSKSASSRSYENSSYFDLPERIRWANDNPSGTACHAAVTRVRQLDNDPSYESDVNVQKRWTEAVNYADSLGCKL